MNLWVEVQQAQQRREAHRENGARDVNLYVTFQTEGSGQLISGEVTFELPFFREPTMLSGVALARLPDETLYRLPSATAGVLRWVRNERGFYTGCFLFFVVECKAVEGQSPTVPAKPVLYHHLMFTGPSYKPMSSEINSSVLDERVQPLQTPTR